MKIGDRITIQHPDYGTLTGNVHGSTTSGFYLPLGVGYIGLGKQAERRGWRIVARNQTENVLREIANFIRTVDVESSEPLQGWMVDEITEILGQVEPAVAPMEGTKQ